MLICSIVKLALYSSIFRSPCIATIHSFSKIRAVSVGDDRRDHRAPSSRTEIGVSDTW